MKLISIFLILISTPCFAEVFYYGDHFLTVDLRSDQPSILRFEKVPLSSACQPGVLRFEPLDPKTLSLGEAQRVQENVTAEYEKDTTVSQLLRVTPQDKSGVVTCSFTLAGGFEVPIRFNLTDSIARPFLDFRPIGEKFANPQVNNNLGLLQSLVKGDSVYLHDITKNFETCSPGGGVDKRDCRKLRASTPTADYELVYAGTDTTTNAWTLSVSLKADSKFAQIADLKAVHGSNVLYSVVSPQKDSYAKGDQLKHYIITGAQVTGVELLEVLP